MAKKPLDEMRSFFACDPEDTTELTTGELAALVMMSEPGEDTYNGTALYAAKQILQWFLENPKRAMDDADPYRAMIEAGVIVNGDLTVFQWGWAVNAARSILELPSVPNPAIVEL